ITSARDLRPVRRSTSVPQSRQGLNILQHPGGAAMMLAICGSGVTWVNGPTGRIQYVTAAKSGSSRAPRLRRRWAVVAVPHPPPPRLFGSIREGILLDAILKEIEGFIG